MSYPNRRADLASVFSFSSSLRFPAKSTSAREALAACPPPTRRSSVKRRLDARVEKHSRPQEKHKKILVRFRMASFNVSSQ